jgi:hypothetical protein
MTSPGMKSENLSAAPDSSYNALPSEAGMISSHSPWIMTWGSSLPYLQKIAEPDRDFVLEQVFHAQPCHLVRGTRKSLSTTSPLRAAW